MRSLLPCALLFAGALLSQDEVQPWRAVRDLRVEGTAVVDRDALVTALLGDVRVMRLLTMAWDDRTSAALAALAQDLYQFNGFADARVVWDRERQTLRVTEGARHLCGEIVCNGNEVIPTAELVAALQERDEGWPGWRAGEPAPSAELAMKVVESLVRRAFANHGHHRAEVEAKTVLRDGALDLQVLVRTEGSPTRVRSVALLGDRAGESEVAVGRLRWQPGALLTKELVEDLIEQLMDCGRYRSIRPQLFEQIPDQFDPLQFEVELAPWAPTFAELDEPGIAQLRRALQRIEAHLVDGRVFSLGFDVPGDQGSVLEVLPGRCEVRWTNAGASVAFPPLRARGGSAQSLHLLIGTDGLGLASGAYRYELEQPIHLSLSLGAVLTADGNAELRWGAGVQQEAPKNRAATAGVFELRVHPAIAAYIRHFHADAIKREQDELVWSSPLGTVRIGADGELPARRIDFARDGRKGRFELLDGDWAQLRGAFRELHPQRVSWHAFVGQLLEGAAAGEQASGDGVSATLLAVVLEGGPDVWAAADGEPKELVRAPREDAGLRPIAVGRGSAPIVGMLLAGTAHPLANGWVCDLLGMAATLQLGRSVAAAGCVSAYAGDPGHGPIALCSGALALQCLGFGEPAEGLLRLANERWSFAAAYADVAGAFARFEAVHAIPARIGARWRSDARSAKWFADVPAGGDGDLVAFRRGLELLWNDGGGEWLRRLMLDDR